MSNWFKELPCPLHPSWGLDDISDLDLCQLKQKIDTENDESMVVETQLYRAFLEYPCGRFYNQGRVSSSKALKYLESATELVNENCNTEAEIGYGIVIYSFRLWIRLDKKTESLLRKLMNMRDKYPGYISYIQIVKAYFLSRLGPRWIKEALSLYELALENFPNNCEWLFGKALMLGREARQMGHVKGWQHKNVKDILQKEMQVLERILDLDPNFNLARAYYGQVLFNLRKEGAGNQISRALQNEPQNQSIVMVAVKYHKNNKSPFTWTEGILKTLLKTSDTAETNYQLGLLYTKKARFVPISERFAIWETALDYFNKGVGLNTCHYPCFTKRAEMYALLGETQKAYDFFKEMFEDMYKNSPHLERNEIMSIDTFLLMRLPKHLRVFSPEEYINLLHRFITLSAKQDDFEDKNEKVERRLENLWRISSYCNDGSMRLLATLKLADAYRCLKRFKKAEELYGKLYQENIQLSYKAEIIWGLAKCYFRQGFFDKTITLANKLDRLDNTVLSSNELYADVYLMKANPGSKSITDKTVCAKDVPCKHVILQNLEQAIQMGSLEACYLFFSCNVALKKKFFDLKLRIPQILAKITLVLEDFCLPIFHTGFKLTMNDGSELIHNEAMKKSVIEEKLKELLIYDPFGNHDDPCNTLLDELKELREKRLELEIELIKRKSYENWNGSCAKCLRSTIQILRELLDHAISFYKESVLRDTSENCIFPVKFEEQSGNVDQRKAKDMINDWISETFTGKLPDETFTTILEVQPMYDKENIWLAALNELNNKLKHRNKVLYALEYFDLTLKKHRKPTKKTKGLKNAMPHPSLRLKTEDIVRKSCKEVERLVLFFISKGEDVVTFPKVANQESEDEDESSVVENTPTKDEGDYFGFENMFIEDED